MFISTTLAVLGMVAGSLLSRPENDLTTKRFHVIINTPVGEEHRLVQAGIRLPAMVDAGIVEAGAEELDAAAIERLYASDSEDKLFGELRRERTLPWYYPGLLRIVLACIALVVGTWLLGLAMPKG